MTENVLNYMKDLGMLLTDEEIFKIRTEMADKLLKPLLESKGYDVDINCNNGFEIKVKGDDENDRYVH